MSSAPMTNNNNNKVQSQGLSSFSSSSSSYVRIEEEIMKQGIITILNTNTPSSLRRTLSADMSSKNYWLSQNIAPSEEQDLHAKTIAPSEEDEEANNNNKELEEEDEAERERLEIWSSIQRNKKEEQEKSGAFDTWSSIMSLKGKDEISKSMPITPYVHPLVKRSKSCLSEKSLEICTESLGSETGSDALLFSSYSSSSETGDADAEQQQQQEKEQVKEEEEEGEEELCNYASVVATKKASASASPPRAFPPPLPSLSHHQASSSVTHMRSHRDNGRLVLEAVSVPSHNNFSIQRQDGRLVLTFSNHQEEEEEDNDDYVEELEEECFGGFEFGEDEEDYYDEEDEFEDDDAEEEEYFFGAKHPQVSSTEGNSVLMSYESVSEKVPLLPTGVTSSVHELALMMNNNDNNKNKSIGIVNRNPKWSDKFNEMTNFDDVNVAAQSSLPPRPRVARLIPSAPAAASFNFNAYEYYWRTKSASPKGTSSVNLNQLDQEKLKSKVVVSGGMNNKVVSREQQQLLVLRGKNGDYLVHNLKSCKDSRRSFLFWEPYCIATS
ncbi:hypothetical protein AAZX31_U021500 [Glycine max]|nr:hypothetical protein JHK86_031231 [Glycine max]KAG5145825.1 hypothetical protein JHK84_031368 [Glycine max]